MSHIPQSTDDPILDAIRDVAKSLVKTLHDFKPTIAAKYGLSGETAGAAIVMGVCLSAHLSATVVAGKEYTDAEFELEIARIVREQETKSKASVNPENEERLN